MDSLAWEIYDYAGLFDVDTLVLDPTNRNIAGNLSIPLLVLGGAYEALGDNRKMIENFLRAYQLSPSPAIRNILSGTTAVGAATDVSEAVRLDLLDTLLSGEGRPESLRGDTGR